MKYDRQDSNAKAKSGKEPQKLDFSMLPPKGYKNTLDAQQAKRNQPKPEELDVDSKYDSLDKKANQRMKRKAMLHAAMNKIHDPDIA